MDVKCEIVRALVQRIEIGAGGSCASPERGLTQERQIVEKSFDIASVKSPEIAMFSQTSTLTTPLRRQAHASVVIVADADQESAAAHVAPTRSHLNG
jgi:hypothetical protein